MSEKKNIDPREKRQSFQADYYNDFADDFDRSCKRENSNHLYKIEQIGDAFFENLAGKPAYDFMELGSGTGIHALHFLRNNNEKINRLLLTDVSENMLSQAEKRMVGFQDKVQYAVMPAEKFTTAEKFDGIFVSGSMHHFASPFAALTEMKKHLKPSGVLVVCEPIVWNPVNMYKALREIKAEYGQFKTQRTGVRKMLEQLDCQIIVDRVLHYRAGGSSLRKVIPYKKMERHRVLNMMAVMFLFAAKAPDS